MTEKGGCPEFEPRAGHQQTFENWERGTCFIFEKCTK